MRFDEHLTIAVRGTVRWQPAWICLTPSCANELFVRASDQQNG
jgi:hypothetical protein